MFVVLLQTAWWSGGLFSPGDLSPVRTSDLLVIALHSGLWELWRPRSGKCSPRSEWSTASSSQKTWRFGAPCPLQSCCLAAHGPRLGWSPTGVEKGMFFFGLQMFSNYLAQNLLTTRFHICLQPTPICLALPILLFRPLHFRTSWMMSSFRQGCLRTGAALTAPGLAYLLFLASTRSKVLANNDHAFCSVACLLFGKVSAGSLQPSREEEEGGQQLMWKINYELPSSCHVVKAVLLSKVYIQPPRKRENTAFLSLNSGNIARTKLSGECHTWGWSLGMLWSLYCSACSCGTTQVVISTFRWTNVGLIAHPSRWRPVCVMGKSPVSPMQSGGNILCFFIAVTW